MRGPGCLFGGRGVFFCSFWGLSEQSALCLLLGGCEKRAVVPWCSLSPKCAMVKSWPLRELTDVSTMAHVLGPGEPKLGVFLFLGDQHGGFWWPQKRHSAPCCPEAKQRIPERYPASNKCRWYPQQQPPDSETQPFPEPPQTPEPIWAYRPKAFSWERKKPKF